MNDDDALHTKEEQLKNGTGNPLVVRLAQLQFVATV
jgi:hypothetical protein